MRGIDPTVLRSVPVSKKDNRGNLFLRLCNLLSWCTTVAATLAVVVDVLLLFSCEYASAAEGTLHCFGVVMALVVILAERETAILLKYCAFLESWLLKGLYISYVGTILLAFKHSDWLLDGWRVAAGFVLVTSGVMYFMLGALCVRQLRSYQLRKIRRKEVMRQELLSLSSKKQEIEKLLADTESKLELL